MRKFLAFVLFPRAFVFRALMRPRKPAPPPRRPKPPTQAQSVDAFLRDARRTPEPSLFLWLVLPLAAVFVVLFMLAQH